MHDVVKIFRDQATTSTDKQYIIVQRFTVKAPQKQRPNFWLEHPKKQRHTLKELIKETNSQFN